MHQELLLTLVAVGDPVVLQENLEDQVEWLFLSQVLHQEFGQCSLNFHPCSRGLGLVSEL